MAIGTEHVTILAEGLSQPAQNFDTKPRLLHQRPDKNQFVTIISGQYMEFHFGSLASIDFTPCRNPVEGLENTGMSAAIGFQFSPGFFQRKQTCQSSYKSNFWHGCSGDCPLGGVRRGNRIIPEQFNRFHAISPKLQE